MGNHWSASASSVTSIDTAKDILIQLENTRRELAIAQILEYRKRMYRLEEEREKLESLLAEEREKLNWSLVISAVLVFSAVVSSFHHKNFLHLLPLGPTAAYLGYKSHFCYGDKTDTITKMANKMLTEDTDDISLAPISVADVRQRMDVIRSRRHEDDFLDSWYCYINVGGVGSDHDDLHPDGSIYKRRDFVIPIAPVIMIAGYRYDAAYGTNHAAIRDSAEAPH